MAGAGLPGDGAELRVGDVLSQPVYGSLDGGPVPVLLLAAGQRIETQQQLDRLRALAHGTPLSSGPSAGGPAVGVGDPDDPEEARAAGAAACREFAQRLQQATRAQQAITHAAADLMARVRAGAPAEIGLLQAAAASLALDVLRDPQSHAALAYLRQCDDYTVEHSADVAILMAALGRLLHRGEDEAHGLALVGLLHDVGKQWVPEAILDKPGPLSEAEQALVRAHPQYGLDILSGWSSCPDEVRQAAYQHHERLDGSGYPQGLAGGQIHSFARLVAVADVFDAMSADRVYHRGIAPRRALRELYESRDRFLDPEAVLALIKLIGVYPVGTRVRLSTGEAGVVAVPNLDDSTRPTVLVDQRPDGHARLDPYPMCLRFSHCCVVGVAV